MNVKFSMKAKLLGLAAVLGVAGTAHAAWSVTPYFTMENMDNTGEGLRVYQSGGVSHNPAGCGTTDWYEPKSGLTTAQKEPMERALLAAFMAGRKVRLGINTTTCGPNGRPGYEIVRLDNAL